MNLSPDRIATSFKETVVAFIDELSIQAPDDYKLSLGRVIVQNTDANKLINNVYSKLLLYEEQIKTRDEGFFLDGKCPLLGSLSTTDNDYFKEFWGRISSNEEDKLIMWEWVDTFMYLSQKYSESL